jgi:hypothetical protein
MKVLINLLFKAKHEENMITLIYNSILYANITLDPVPQVTEGNVR